MHFGQIDLLRRHPRHGIGLGGRETGQSRLVQASILASGECTCPHAQRTVPSLSRQPGKELARTQEGCSGAVADRRAHRASEGIADQAILEHLLGRQDEAILRERIERAHRVILGRGHSQLPECGAVFLHVVGRLHGIGGHEDGAAARIRREGLARLLPRVGIVVLPLFRIERVYAALEYFPGPVGVGRDEGFLHADGKREIRLPGEDVLPGAVKRHRCRCTSTLHIDHGHPLRKQAFAHQRREAHLPADVALAESPHPAVGEPGHSNGRAVGEAGVVEDHGVSLPGEVLEGRIGMFAEFRTGGTDHVDVAHELISRR